MSIRFGGSIVALLCSAVVGWSAPAGDLVKGTVVVVSNNPQSLLVFDHDGAFVESFPIPQTTPPEPTYATATVYDARDRKLYAATAYGRFSQYGDLLSFDREHPHELDVVADLQELFVAQARFAQDATGNLYAAHGGIAEACENPTPADPCPNRTWIHKLSRGLEIADTYLVTGAMGIGALDVTSNGGLLYYTSNGVLESYDTEARQQLPTVVLADRMNGVALLPPFDGTGGVLVTVDNPARVLRLDAAGAAVQSYPLTGSFCGSVAIDVGGTAFWAGSRTSGSAYESFLTRVNVATGALEVGPVSLGHRSAGDLTVIGPPTHHKAR